ncbi:MAG TPA: transglutaminase family protein [Kofleriaceae bacterium]|nr:transglutaminase family protein [Kofleriaceae bacterium]
MSEDVSADCAALDEQVARKGLDVWLGAEPTFTRADSTDAPWCNAADGGDKLERARALLGAFARHLPHGATLHRVVGRHFPGEDAPRFAWAARWPRSGAPEKDHRLYPPPVDAPAEPAPALQDDDAWLTVTPDPGVVEVNLAPSPDLTSFLAQAEAVYDAARAAGLAPDRFRYNGDHADSGGGGQLTLGGPSPDASPFFRHPDVLPALIRYLNNHPSLSYWFASECVGSASQSPRPDEGVRERYDELAVALDWCDRLASKGSLDRETLWSALAPLMVDAAGNSHRAECNLEKLWSPHGARGRLGVVELRAFRMPPRPSMLAAAAALLRAIVARLASHAYKAPLIDWHDELHDLWALPRALDDDLRHVLGDLDEHGLGLTNTLRAELEAWRDPGITCRLGAATLSIRRAIEFWPLVGDVASQERETSRVVDASTERLQLAITGGDHDWLVVNGRRAHLIELHGAKVVAVRRRAWVPRPGLHPGLPAIDPIVIEWGAGASHQRVELWGWRPGGGVYDGLPVDATAAAERRAERVRVESHDGALPRPRAAHVGSGYTIDLRRDSVDA